MTLLSLRYAGRKLWDHWETQCASSTHMNEIGGRSAMSEAYTEPPEEGDRAIQ